MGGYTKNIAVIREIKAGFSADGGALSGLVKCERYGGEIKIEVTYINFAPLSEGRYVCAVSDGEHLQVVENGLFEGSSPVDTSKGFAALICFVNGGVSAVASAVSGNFHGVTLGIREQVERLENAAAQQKPQQKARGVAKQTGAGIYNDEAIAEVNYYEFAETDAGGGAVRKGAQKEKDGRAAYENETAVGAFQKEQSGVDPAIYAGNAYFNDKNAAGGLAGGDFYARMKSEIEGLFESYPAEEELAKVVSGSRWVKITYGDGKYYVFGVICYDGKPRYICYGVPANGSKSPPESMQNFASFIPTDGGGYWTMYQDAATGASIKLNAQ